MRLITARADANLAAVNYHFGGKDALIHAMLTRRLDGLNQNRLALLERFQSIPWFATHLRAYSRCDVHPGARAIPLSRKAALLCCASSAAPTPIRHRSFAASCAEFYAGVAERFFNAFQTVLPHLPREELGWRLHFCIGSLEGILAGADTDSRIADFTQGRRLEDSQLIGRLALVMVAALKAPLFSRTASAIRRHVRRARTGSNSAATLEGRPFERESVRARRRIATCHCLN